MSSNLYWQPAKKAEKLLSDQLKFALKALDMFSDTIDGTYGNDMIPYLRGMEVAGIEDARKLIDAIEKYGEVELEERY